MYELDNFIGVFPNSVSNESCDALIDHYENMSVLNKTLNRRQTGKHSTIHKDNSVYLFLEDPENIHLNITHGLLREFSQAFWHNYEIYRNKYGVLEFLEGHKLSSYGAKIQKNNPGEGYHIWHCEHGGRLVGDRLLLIILYLNDVEEGGETEFLYQSKRVYPKKGTMLICPSGYTHTHRGNPPIGSTKYILNTWAVFTD